MLYISKTRVEQRYKVYYYSFNFFIFICLLISCESNKIKFLINFTFERIFSLFSLYFLKIYLLKTKKKKEITKTIFTEKKEDNFSIETFCKSRNAQKWMPCLSVVQCLSGRDNVRFDLSTIAHVNTAEKYKCQQKAITGLTTDDRRIGNNVIMKRTMLPCYVIKIDREVTYWLMDGVRVSSGVDTVFVFDEQTEGKLKDLLKEENVKVAAHVKLQSE